MTGVGPDLFCREVAWDVDFWGALITFGLCGIPPVPIVSEAEHLIVKASAALVGVVLFLLRRPILEWKPRGPQLFGFVVVAGFIGLCAYVYEYNSDTGYWRWAHWAAYVFGCSLVSMIIGLIAKPVAAFFGGVWNRFNRGSGNNANAD